MPTKTTISKKSPRKSARKATSAKPPVRRVTRSTPADIDGEVRTVLSWLEEKSTQRDLDNLQRFGIAASQPFGVSMSNMKLMAKRLGRNHALAEALWSTGRYEAQMVATLIDDPAIVTPAQMDRWCRDFDNWGICDTACFFLFDRSPHAWAKVAQWSGRREEFVKRAAFALLASLALHDKDAADKPFMDSLKFIESAATDERNFVKKGVSWALRSVGRRNAAVNGATVVLARRLSTSENAAARWIGKGAVRELTSPAVVRKLGPRAARAGGPKRKE